MLIIVDRYTGPQYRRPCKPLSSFREKFSLFPCSLIKYLSQGNSYEFCFLTPVFFWLRLPLVGLSVSGKRWLP
ncbi:unnamed protein product [Brassica oleracea]|uniref:Uncharacterized protein n=1 Tax=Brassica oleracea TaxID=3712 RepID=A0A3P6EBP6_BRAOL|nr:unnamed protein product [Brassica oleracea]